MEIFLGILIPFIGTTLGAACVLFMKKTGKLDGEVIRQKSCFLLHNSLSDILN